MLTDESKEILLKSLYVIKEDPEYVYFDIEQRKSLEHDELVTALESIAGIELQPNCVSFSELKFDLGPLKGCWIAARSQVYTKFTYKLSVDNVEGSLEPYDIRASKNFKPNRAMCLTFENVELDFTLDRLAKAALKRWGARSQVMQMVKESHELSSVLVTLGFRLESFESTEKLTQKVAREICGVENVLIQLAVVWDMWYDSPSLQEPEEYEQVGVSKEPCLFALRNLADATRLILSDPTWENHSTFCPSANKVIIFNKIEHAVRIAKQMIPPDTLLEERVSRAKKFYKYVKEELCTQQN